MVSSPRVLRFDSIRVSFKLDLPGGHSWTPEDSTPEDSTAKEPSPAEESRDNVRSRGGFISARKADPP